MKTYGGGSKPSIAVYSVSPVALMEMGGVKAMGMPSIMAFHRELGRKGFDVTYLQIGGDPQNDLDQWFDGLRVKKMPHWTLPRILRKSRIFSKFLGLPLLVISAFWPMFLFLRAEKERHNGRVVIYGHLAPGAILASLLSMTMRVPNVSRLYGTLLPYHFGISEQYPVGKLRRYLNLLRYYDETLAFLMPSSAHVITDDGTLGDRLFRALRGPDKRLEFVRNGLDIDWKGVLEDGADPSITERYFENGWPLVVSAGRMIAWKRFDRTVEIAARLREKGVNVNFLILGRGDEEPRIQEMIRQRGLEDRVKIKNNTPHSEMPAFLMAADVVLLTQDYTNLSNTLLESLALERPVVVLDVGGTSMVANDGYNCLTISLANVHEEAAAAIVRILESTELRYQLREGCRDWKGEGAYSWEKRTEVEVNLIKSLLNNENYRCST
ncbi:MAG: glycosyltransferase family 4 protein [Desulfobacterales bacterium]|nr:glycosyltransferase family 4 protein [Desulfobacterales bacterium]